MTVSRLEFHLTGCINPGENLRSLMPGRVKQLNPTIKPGSLPPETCNLVLNPESGPKPGFWS